MRLAIFGDTNRTKNYLIKKALDAGYSVNVLESVSKKEKSMKSQKKNLSVINGFVNNNRDISRTLSNVDAVLVILQNPQHHLSTEMENIIRNITVCMEERSIRRLVVFSYIHEELNEKKDNSSKILNTIKSILSGTKNVSLNQILSCTGIDWTIVGHRPATETLDEDIANTVSDSEEFRKRFAKHMISQITDVKYLKDTLVLPV